MKYDELVKALRICSSELNCGDCPLLYRDSCSSDELMSDAAAAIEALQAEVKDAFNEGYNAGYTAGIGYCSFKRSKQRPDEPPQEVQDA